MRQLPRSQEPTTCPHLVPHGSIPCSPILFNNNSITIHSSTPVCQTVAYLVTFPHRNPVCITVLSCVVACPPNMLTDLHIVHSAWIVQYRMLLWNTPTVFIIILVLFTAHAFRCLSLRHISLFRTLWQQQGRRRQGYWRKYERRNTLCHKQSMNYCKRSCVL